MRHPDTARASRAFEDFTGRKAARVRQEKLDSGPVVGWELGPLVGVAYEAVRDGKKDRYFHEFAEKSRPRLVAREDGRQLYIAGGKYKVTERGVVDVSPLFVVNPHRRKGKPMARRSTAKRRRRTPGVVVVTRNPARRRRRMSAAQRAYFGGGRRPRRRSRGFLSNPHRRRSVRRRSYKRNPSMRASRERLMHLLVPAAGIGLGAIGTELLLPYLPLPAQLKTGPMKYVTKGAVGVAAGLLVGTMLKQKRLGKYIAAGAVAIAVHDGVKALIIQNMPSVKFGQFVPASHMHGLGYNSPASLVGMGEFVGPIRHMAGLAGDGPGNNGGGGETNFAL